MKGVVLLAVIHIFIIYQSEKKKVRPMNEVPDPPQVVVKAQPAALKHVSQTLKPGYTTFMFTRNGPSWTRNLGY